MGDDAKTKAITVRFSKSELENLTKMAKSFGISSAEYIRQATAQGAGFKDIEVMVERAFEKHREETDLRFRAVLHDVDAVVGRMAQVTSNQCADLLEKIYSMLRR